MNDSVLNNERQQRLRDLLEAKKRGLLGELRKSMGEQRSESSRMSFELAQDDGDKSVEDHEQHVLAAVQSMKSEQLDDIEQALKKLHEGSYGICEECGAAIPFQRLEIQPLASYCVPCQEEIDRIGKRETLINKEPPLTSDESYEYLPDD
jgi:DnaK suppressor protein